MNSTDLQAWQTRVVGNGYGAQVKAAALLNTPPQTYRNWITGRFEILGPVERLTQYIERFGPIDQGNS